MHGVVVREERIGGYRDPAAHTVVATPPGGRFIEVFAGRRAKLEERLATVHVTGGVIRFVVMLTLGALVCVAVIVAASPMFLPMG